MPITTGSNTLFANAAVIGINANAFDALKHRALAVEADARLALGVDLYNLGDLAGAERDLPEAEFCQWLVKEVGVAAIPLSAFYGDGFDQRVVRFCFAKKDETLIEAAARLRKL